MEIKPKKEVEYYIEIAKELASQIKSNISDQSYEVIPLIGEISAALQTIIANGYNAGDLLRKYSQTVHRLHLDIAILVENKNNSKYELVVFEIKRVNNLGLTELSQLIGYCLVSQCKFGVLINVDKAVSKNFSIILDADKNLTKIVRLIDENKVSHEFGVMVWNSKTLKVEYTQSGSIKSLPELVEKITHNIKTAS